MFTCNQISFLLYGFQESSCQKYLTFNCFTPSLSYPTPINILAGTTEHNIILAYSLSIISQIFYYNRVKADSLVLCCVSPSSSPILLTVLKVRSLQYPDIETNAGESRMVCYAIQCLIVFIHLCHHLCYLLTADTLLDRGRGCTATTA